MKTQEHIRVAVGPDESDASYASLLKDLPFPVEVCHSLDELVAFAPTTVIIDKTLSRAVDAHQLREQLPLVPLLARPDVSCEVEFPLGDRITPESLTRLVKTACELYFSRLSSAAAREIAETAESDLTKLAEVGVALSAERDLNRLLKRILEAAQDIACCDAASLFLLDREATPAELVFKLTLNDSVAVAFQEQRFLLDTRSISGYVAETGEAVHCEDVYLMGPEQPFRFNPGFDKQTGYRTRSLYCVPMTDNTDQVVGVIQFLNRKHRRDDKVTQDNWQEVVRDFDGQVRKSLLALASLSAVALQTRKLLDDINNLFESFVHASVTAIEQRDPTTSGHSFRVADLSVVLAERVHTASRSDLARFKPSAATLRELRYAALLHDFGKVGVRESVLVKSKKLFASELNELRYRLALTRQRMRADAAEEIISLYESGKGDSTRINQIRQGFTAESHRLAEFLELIVDANEPSILEENTATRLEELGEYACDEHDGDLTPLLSSGLLEALSTRRGSLTNAERREIESHVVHTYNFLKLIPWTGDLAGVPDIAGRHHEKLDGSGYPDNLDASDIPLQSRIMTICDIFDALTASDRPYKKALPHQVAYRILREDAQRGTLDPGVVEVFIGADVAASIAGKTYPKASAPAGGQSVMSVCDPDLHCHDTDGGS